MTAAAPVRIRIDRPELADDLVASLAAGDCLCDRVSDDTLVVFHRDAADEREALVELRFFLTAWERRHKHVRAELM